MQVICVKCKECGRLATKLMRWVLKEPGKEEVLLCECKSREWIFISMDSQFIGPDVLVINKGD